MSTEEEDGISTEVHDYIWEEQQEELARERERKEREERERVEREGQEAAVAAEVDVEVPQTEPERVVPTPDPGFLPRLVQATNVSFNDRISRLAAAPVPGPRPTPTRAPAPSSTYESYGMEERRRLASEPLGPNRAQLLGMGLGGMGAAGLGGMGAAGLGGMGAAGLGGMGIAGLGGLGFALGGYGGGIGPTENILIQAGLEAKICDAVKKYMDQGLSAAASSEALRYARMPMEARGWMGGGGGQAMSVGGGGGHRRPTRSLDSAMNSRQGRKRGYQNSSKIYGGGLDMSLDDIIGKRGKKVKAGPTTVDELDDDLDKFMSSAKLKEQLDKRAAAMKLPVAAATKDKREDDNTSVQPKPATEQKRLAEEELMDDETLFGNVNRPPTPMASDAEDFGGSSGKDKEQDKDDEDSWKFSG